MAAAAPAAHGAGTLVLAASQQHAAGPSTAAVAESVTLRLVPRRKKKSVKWAEDVADFDEFAGKRKSKKCCIFHRRRQFGDWSDGDDSDAECDCSGDAGPGEQPQQQHAPAPQPTLQPV